MIRYRQQRQPQGRCVRKGLTILEVILALGIFLASATVISQLLGTGTRAAVEGRLRSQMALLAESQMAEVGAGVLDMTPTSSQAFDTGIEVDPSLTWSLEVEEGGQGDLLIVTVLVEHTNDQDDVDQNFTLTRMMRDPQIWLDAAEEEAE